MHADRHTSPSLSHPHPQYTGGCSCPCWWQRRGVGSGPMRCWRQWTEEPPTECTPPSTTPTSPCPRRPQPPVLLLLPRVRRPSSGRVLIARQWLVRATRGSGRERKTACCSLWSPSTARGVGNASPIIWDERGRRAENVGSIRSTQRSTTVRGPSRRRIFWCRPTQSLGTNGPRLRGFCQGAQTIALKIVGMPQNGEWCAKAGCGGTTPKRRC